MVVVVVEVTEEEALEVVGPRDHHLDGQITVALCQVYHLLEVGKI